MNVAMATKVSVAPGSAPGSALNTGGAPKMSIESPPRTASKKEEYEGEAIMDFWPLERVAMRH